MEDLVPLVLIVSYITMTSLWQLTSQYVYPTQISSGAFFIDILFWVATPSSLAPLKTLFLVMSVIGGVVFLIAMFHEAVKGGEVTEWDLRSLRQKVEAKRLTAELAQ